VRHIFKVKRAGQARGPSWFGPVILRMKDLDEFEDATLMKQKVAACSGRAHDRHGRHKRAAWDRPR
jgi:capsid protein